MKRSSGITLIALVVTIIILAILVGVSINAIVNQGIMEKTNQAVGLYQEKSKEEEKLLEDLNDELEFLKAIKWSGGTEEFTKGNGTEEDPYQIETPEQLAYLGQRVNEGETFQGKSFIITASFNMEGKNEDGSWGLREWIPIGLGGTSSPFGGADPNPKYKFKGTIDGNNHKIYNIYISKPTNKGVGLFGVIDSEATIKNIVIASGKIIGKSDVGGIVGSSKGNIEGCINRAEVMTNPIKGDSYSGQEVGGILGDQQGGSVIACMNLGTVTCDYNSQAANSGIIVGGVVGNISNGVISSCTNSGEVEGKSEVGGIVGLVRAGTVKENTNKGQVNAETLVSGIVGYASSTNLSIESCNNEGKIHGEDAGVAGIISILTGGVISQCTNIGDISTGSLNAGGIAAINEGTIKNCENKGKVTVATNQSGGIAAVNEGTVMECNNQGEIVAEDSIAGGIVAWNKGEVKSNNNKGLVLTNNANAGGIVGANDATIIECNNDSKIVAMERTSSRNNRI